MDKQIKKTHATRTTVFTKIRLYYNNYKVFFKRKEKNITVSMSDEVFCHRTKMQRKKTP